MKVTLSWLQEFVDIPWSIDELAHQLTMAGLEIESCTYLGAAIKDVIVGEVRSVSKHPDADKLLVANVWDGEKELQVVSGAPNTNVGGKYPLAGIGTTLPNGITLKPTKLRGVMSEGMLCAEDELGLSADHSGLLELPARAKAGDKVAAYLGLDDWLFDLEITPNRGDWFGVIGIAREIAALTNQTIRMPEYSELPKCTKDFAIRIENGDDCPRYIGRVIRNVKVEPSPEWIQLRLKSVGLRPINNIVDISNLIMWETGQPLHAFDLDRLHGPEIIVRNARMNETIIGLDKEEYKLDEEILVIADHDRPVALAGMLGGLETGVTENTKNLLLECANFNQVRIRIGSNKLDIHTDSCTRFSRGVDLEYTAQAADYLASMVLKVAGGELGSKMVDVHPKPWSKRKLILRVSRVKLVLGIDVPEVEIERILRNLGLGVEKSNVGEFQVTIPGYRIDLEREVDLIEEIARIWGYDKIPTDMSVRKGARLHKVHREMFVQKLRELLSAQGLTEIMSYSIAGPEWGQKLKLPEDDERANLVFINDITSPEKKTMISSLVPKMLDTIAYNQARQNKDLMLFEIGKTFRLKNNQPQESLRLTIAVVGNANLLSWNEVPRSFDLFDLKGIWEVICLNFLVDNSFANYYYSASNRSTYFTSNWIGMIQEACRIGEIGEIKAEIAHDWDISGKVILLDIDLETIIAQPKETKRFKPISPYPSIRRDLAFKVPPNVSAEDIRKIIIAEGGKHLEKVTVFDRFAGISGGEVGIGFALWFRSYDATLREEEVDKWVVKLLNRINRELQVVLRT